MAANTWPVPERNKRNQNKEVGNEIWDGNAVAAARRRPAMAANTWSVPERCKWNHDTEVGN
eukprot:707880-Pelagomonas_calceolata.AAC.1